MHSSIACKFEKAFLASSLFQYVLEFREKRKKNLKSRIIFRSYIYIYKIHSYSVFIDIEGDWLED